MFVIYFVRLLNYVPWHTLNQTLSKVVKSNGDLHILIRHIVIAMPHQHLFIVLKHVVVGHRDGRGSRDYIDKAIVAV